MASRAAWPVAALTFVTWRDKRVLRLIGRFLRAGVMLNGVVQETVEGTPQGGPLSPLLANIMLDDLDHELERRGHAFVRGLRHDQCAASRFPRPAPTHARP